MKIITLDFETAYSDEYTLKKLSTSEYITDDRFECLGLAVKVDGKLAKWISKDRVAAWLTAAKPTLESNIVLAHHAHFDGLILSYHYDIRPKAWLDTLCMAKGLGLNVTVGGSLFALCKHFNLGLKPDITPTSTPAELETRGTWDADATYALFRLLAVGFPKEEYKHIDLTIRQFTEPMILADVAKLTKLAGKLDAAKEKALIDLGVDATELGSPALFCSRLESLGVDVEWKQSPAGNRIPAIAKTDDFMVGLLESEDETIQALAAARLGNKSTGDGTRARRYIAMAKNGALPVYYNYYGAHTGRWSGGDKTNFANLRRGGELRDSILAPEHHSFVVGDLAQIEARITAVLAGQEDLVESFRVGGDPYCEFASYAFRREVTKKDEYERFVGKTTVLGCGFGCGGRKYALQFKAEINKRGLPYDALSQEAAQGIVDAYRAKYLEIPKLWKRADFLLGGPDRKLGPVVSENEAILLPNGMKLRYPNLRFETYLNKQRVSERGWRYDNRNGRTHIYGAKLIENIAQALARIVMADAMLALHKKGFKIPLHTYDEIVLCVPDASVENARMEMQRLMTTVPAWMPELPLAVEIGVGKSYGEAH
jgi:DNA polymerase